MIKIGFGLTYEINIAFASVYHIINEVENTRPNPKNLYSIL